MDDDAAIQRVLAGDVDAFAVLVERYRVQVFAVTRHLLPDPAMREDVAQEAFVDAFNALGRFDTRRARFSTWLLTIARNRALNALRAARARRVATAAALPPPPGAAAGPVEGLEAALETLPPEQRLAFVLAEAHGLSYVQVATVQQVPVGTVRSRIARARVALRTALHDMEQTR